MDTAEVDSAQGESRARLGPPQLKWFRISSEGLCPRQSSPANHCGTITQQPNFQKKKKISAGNPGTETKDQTGMGDGYRNYLSRRVWPQLDFQAVKAPSFSTVLHPGPGTQRAQQETWEVES